MTDRQIQGFTLVASVAGLAVSVYLTSVHYAAAQLVCTVGGPINCERVLGSGYAVIAGSSLPTSAAGIVWFAVSAAIAIAIWLRMGVRSLQVAWSVVGLLTVIYLLFVEIVLVGALCLWCTAVHVLVIAIFLATVTIRRAAFETER